MRVAVVGLGYWGPQLVRNLVWLDSCSSVVACDLDETRVKDIQQHYPMVEGSTDLDAVLADDDVAAVVLATPVKTHYALGRKALLAGKNVLIEKPLATSVAEASDLMELAKSRSLLVMAGHTFLYSPPVQKVRELVDAGEVGTPLYAQSSRVNLGIHQSDVSVIWDLAPHDLSILFYWLREMPVSVSATGRVSHGRGQVDVAFIDLEFPSGFVANIHLSWLAPTKMRRTTLVGTKRMLVYEDTNSEEPVKLYDKGLDFPRPEDFGQFKMVYRTGDIVAPQVSNHEPLRAEMDDFINRIARSEVPNGREETALNVVATIQAAEASLAQRGVPIEIDPASVG